MRDETIIDAEYEVVSGPHDQRDLTPSPQEPILLPGWPLRLAMLLAPPVVMFLVRAWQVPHWPFG